MKSSTGANRFHPHSTKYYLAFGKTSRRAGYLATIGFFRFSDIFNHNNPKIDESKDQPIQLEEQDQQAQDSMPRQQLPPEPQPAGAVAAQNPLEGIDSNVLQAASLQAITKRANEVLAEASTVFPFTLFPDTIRLDRSKLTVIRRTFFFTSRTIGIHIEDMLNIALNTGPFFGSLNIGMRGLSSEDHFQINFLWRKDAIHLKHMIQGYITAQRDKLDYDQLDKDNLIRTLTELGEDTHRDNYMV